MNTNAMPGREAVARALKGLIAERRITQVTVAAQSDMSRASLAKKLAGTTPFTVDELERIAIVLGVSLAEIMESAERVRGTQAAS